MILKVKQIIKLINLSLNPQRKMLLFFKEKLELNIRLKSQILLKTYTENFIEIR